jgi:hypothetical protein
MEVLKNFLFIFLLFTVAGTVIAVLMVGGLFFYLYWPVLVSLLVGAVMVFNEAILFGAGVIVAGLVGQYVWNRRVDR